MSNGTENGSENTGSPIAGPAVDPNAPAGQPGIGQSANNNGEAASAAVDADFEKQYKELEQKFGQQGQELGEYRQFFQSVSPLLDKLDKDPELVQAILDGKIDNDLVKAVVDGRVNVEDAQVVTEAKKQAEEAAGGEKEFKGLSSEDAEKLIEKKVQEVRREIEQNAELQSFEAKTAKFIDETQDFAEYAEEIDKWLDSHDVADIEVAYYAVKGQMSAAEAAKKAEEADAEKAKEIALNASGGGITSQYAEDGTPLVDKLISGQPNPNKL